MDLQQMREVVAALDVAERDGLLPHHGYFDMQHDILYIPWDRASGPVAVMLDAAGCHWDDDAECWAHF